jgi:Uma2 family endonuclease
MSITIYPDQTHSDQTQPDQLSEEDLYPSSDGEPMAESDLHADEMIYVRNGIGLWFESRADVYVSGNTFLYYQQGNRSAVVSPDLYVVFGVPKRLRDSYQAWKEGGKLPAVVLEITSKSTQQIDVRTEQPHGRNKFDLYEQVLQVPEYFLFDPTGDYLEPRLQGYRLLAGNYIPIEPEPQPLPNLAEDRQPGYRLHSTQLGLDLAYEGQHLRLHDPITGEPLLRAAEAMHRADEAMGRAAEAMHRADEAMGRAAEAMHRADEAVHRADEAVHQAEAERQRADAEAQARVQADMRAGEAWQRAEAEAQARLQAEAELARLRAQLEAIRQQQV